MSSGTNRLLECPDWDQSDPFRSTKIQCWFLLVDAMKKSVMCNDLRDLDSEKTIGDAVSARGLKLANSPIRDLVEARAWLMDLNNRGEAKIGCGDCIDAVGVGEHALKSILRGLWLRRDKYVCGTLTRVSRVAQGVMWRERRKHPEPRRGPWTGEKTRGLADRALYMVRESHKRLGVE